MPHGGLLPRDHSPSLGLAVYLGVTDLNPVPQELTPTTPPGRLEAQRVKVVCQDRTHTDGRLCCEFTGDLRVCNLNLNLSGCEITTPIL